VSQPRTVIWITTRVVLYHTNICTYVRRDKSHILILHSMQLLLFQSHGSCGLCFSGLADHTISCFRISRITQLAASAFCVSHNITGRAARGAASSMKVGTVTAPTSTNTHTMLYSLPVLPVSVTAAAAALAASAC
jgi:hypothetical protein